MHAAEIATRSTLVIEHAAATRTPWSRAAIALGYAAVFLVALPAVLWQLGLRLDRWLALTPPEALARALGALVGTLAATRVVEAMLFLSQRGDGLPISHLAPARLVTAGRYARVRHPIYLSFNLAWSGLALVAGSWGAAFGAGAVLLVAWIAYARAVEEPRLVARFGERYRAYAAATPLVVGVPGWLRVVTMRAWRRAAPAFERLANHTVAWRGARVALVTYGLFVGAGAFAMVLWSGAMLGALGVSSTRFFPFGVAVGLAMLVGGRCAGVLYRLRLLFASPVEALRTVGFVSWGGYAGMIAAALAGAGWLGLAPGAVLDRLLLPGLLCSAIGRFGCLSYGCCGGRPWAHGVCWRNPDARVVRELGQAAIVPRIPTQLLSSALALGLMLVLLGLTPFPLPAGALSALGVLLYGLGRAVIETTREEARFGGCGWTRGLFASLAVAAIGLAAALAIGGTPAWPRPAWVAPSDAWLAVLPAAFACGVMTTLVTGIHGRRVGRW